MSADLAAFLAACYDEAEAEERELAAWAAGRELHIGFENFGEATPFRDYDPAHRLADIRLKRAILAAHPRVETMFVECGTCHESEEGWAGTVPVQWPCATVRQLGTEFAGRDGYRDEWRPET